MTSADRQPAEPTDTVRRLLDEPAADYAAAKEHRRHAQANATADAQTNATADAAENGGAW